MSGGLAAVTSHRRYGATDAVPDVAFAGLSNDEIEKLCEKVANNIHIVSNNTKKLERDARNVGTARDNQNLRDSIHVTQLKCNQLVSETIGELQELNRGGRIVEKQTRLRVERLQNDVTSTVLSYSHIQKQVADKLKQYVLPMPVSPTGEGSDQFHLREQEAAYNQQQRQVQMELEFEGGMLSDRLNIIKGIEADVLDVNVIMKTLATLVDQQGEVVDTIEQNTENTLANVESAAEELTKAAGYVGRRRRTVVCIAFVAVIIAVIILVVLLTK